MCTAVVLRKDLSKHSCRVRQIALPHLAQPSLPQALQGKVTPRYVRRSPTASPQVFRHRRDSGRRPGSTHRRMPSGAVNPADLAPTLASLVTFWETSLAGSKPLPAAAVAWRTSVQ